MRQILEVWCLGDLLIRVTDEISRGIVRAPRNGEYLLLIYESAILSAIIYQWCFILGLDMIDQLPREILLIIVKLLDRKFESKKHPDHIFRHNSQLLVPLSQTSRTLRDKILPLITRHISFVRKHEIQMGQSHQFVERGALMLFQLSGLEEFVTQLEVHSTLDLRSLKNFVNVKSLTILGDTSSFLKTHVDFQLDVRHLAISLPNSRNFIPCAFFKPQSLVRLDLLLDNGSLTPNTLALFENSPLKELNITMKGSPGFLTWRQFLSFLSKLRDTLDTLSIRRRGRSCLEVFEKQDALPIYELFNTISRLSLQKLEIDLSFLNVYADLITRSSSEFLIPKEVKTDLDVTFIEPALASPFTTYQQLTALKFLLQLAHSYTIRSLKFVHGLQTELPQNTALMILLDLLVRIRTDSQFEALKSIDVVITLLAWNIQDDSQVFKEQVSYPYTLLSYETNYRFSPNYKKLIKCVVKEAQPIGNAIYLEHETIHDAPSNDYQFWSAEVLSKDLLLFDTKRKSTLWD